MLQYLLKIITSADLLEEPPKRSRPKFITSFINLPEPSKKFSKIVNFNETI